MDELEKLLRKISKQDRARLLAVLQALTAGQLKGLQIKKLASNKLFRVRAGNFRIIFCIKRDQIEIMAVKMRNEKTYG